MNITAVIPAYNEEKTIGLIVPVIKSVPIINEVLVVSDGSVDGTAALARAAGARVIELTDNIGKGGAMMLGVQSTNADVILFLDADLVGLTPAHVLDLLLPVVTGQVETTIGIFGRGRLTTDLAQVIAPYLSGQRVIKRELLMRIPNLDITRFGVEVALTRFIRKEGIPIREVELNDMTHIMKEEKLGLIKGFRARMKMYWEIVKVGKNGLG